jgi:hypothetical protein
MELVHGRAQAVLDIAGKYEFQIWKAVATCLNGAALAGMGQAEEGLLQINRGMVLYEELKTPPIFWPILLLLRAGICGQAGKPAEGLSLLDEALNIIGKGSGNPISSDFFRLKGNLLLALTPDNQAGAEYCFQQALQISRERKVGMLTLRAAISLILRREQDKGQGRQLQDARKLTRATTADLK